MAVSVMKTCILVLFIDHRYHHHARLDQAMLAEGDIQVQPASTMAHACEFLGLRRYDAVIVNPCIMAGTREAEVTELLAALAGYKRIIAIAEKRGALAYVPKGFHYTHACTIESLKDTLKLVIAGKEELS